MENKNELTPKEQLDKSIIEFYDNLNILMHEIGQLLLRVAEKIVEILNGALELIKKALEGQRVK